MKTPKEILDSKPNDYNIMRLESYLEKRFNGEPLEYCGSLTDADIHEVSKHGWIVEKKSNCFVISSYNCTMIDPPEGWKYGFPKQFINEDGTKPTNVKQWLVDNGYPEKLINSYGKHFTCRYFNV